MHGNKRLHCSLHTSRQGGQHFVKILDPVFGDLAKFYLAKFKESGASVKREAHCHQHRGCKTLCKETSSGRKKRGVGTDTARKHGAVPPRMLASTYSGWFQHFLRDKLGMVGGWASHTQCTGRSCEQQLSNPHPPVDVIHLEMFFRHFLFNTDLDNCRGSPF